MYFQLLLNLLKKMGGCNPTSVCSGDINRPKSNRKSGFKSSNYYGDEIGNEILNNNGYKRKKSIKPQSLMNFKDNTCR